MKKTKTVKIKANLCIFRIAGKEIHRAVYTPNEANSMAMSLCYQNDNKIVDVEVIENEPKRK